MLNTHPINRLSKAGAALVNTNSSYLLKDRAQRVFQQLRVRQTTKNGCVGSVLIIWLLGDAKVFQHQEM